ncbi:MAG: ribosome biogenesis GTPase Der [Proteobacteria bacterium]|nr:ribosome biogenesis GTPase Der [Pseudomonadota bacterium]
MDKQTQSITVALVGSVNVGKSTVFNWMCGKQIKLPAIISEKRGSTRDTNRACINFFGMQINLIDTAGFSNEDSEINTQLKEQQLDIVHSADLLLFIIDGVKGIGALELEYTRYIRKFKKPTALLINKCDTKDLQDINQIYGLGIDNNPIFISAAHRRGLEKIADAIRNRLPTQDDIAQQNIDDDLSYHSINTQNNLQEEFATQDSFKIAIVGKPNVGKSTITNLLLEYKSSIISSEAGTTRDAVTRHLYYKNNKIELVDTAGLRRRSKIHEEIEQSSSYTAISALKLCDVAILVFDANSSIEKQDLKILNLAFDMYKGIVLIANKCDMLDDLKKSTNDIRDSISQYGDHIKNSKILFLSATKNKNCREIILNEALLAKQDRSASISTSKLNKWLKDAIEIHRPKIIKGQKLKIKYITQVSYMPLIFKLFVNKASLLTTEYKTYLSRSLIKNFNIKYTQVRIKVIDSSKKITI